MSDTNGNTGHKQRRSEAFFGRRKSKSLSTRQQKLFDTHLPTLKLSTDTTSPAVLADCFTGAIQSIALEIGFGGGEHLIHQSKTHPSIGHIGVEPFVNSMAKALTAIKETQIQN
ncbi:MAG: tRNA (guanosine(46)-N7)-methyltransferase TrmB, partial [Pseudomonadota bacterium]